MQAEDVFRLVLMDLPGPTLDPESLELIRRFPVRGVVLFRRNLRSASQAAELIAELQRWIPEPIFAVDQEGGSVVRLLDVPVCPSAMALGAVDDVRLTREAGAAMAGALRAVGINLNFAPVADVNLQPENPVIGPRAFGSGVELVSRHVAAFVEGHQAGGVAACAKHFPGHGDTSVDSHLDMPTLPHSLERLERVELPPFQAAIRAGCASVMPGHLQVRSLDSRPATVSSRVLEGLLRGQLGFDGVIVTDALDMQGIARDWGASAAAEALAAGADLTLILGAGKLDALERLAAVARDGRLPAARIEAALSRVAALVRRFPSVITGFQRQPEAEELMESLAWRAVTRIGQIEPVLPDEELILISRGPSKMSAKMPAATDRESIIEESARQLGQTFPRLRRVSYPENDPLDCMSELMEKVSDASRVLWLSASRFRPTPAERELAWVAARWARSFVHLCVYNPYSALDVPLPALLTYGFRATSLRALSRALLEPGACLGRLPIELGAQNAASS